MGDGDVDLFLEEAVRDFRPGPSGSFRAGAQGKVNGVLLTSAGKPECRQLERALLIHN